MKDYEKRWDAHDSGVPGEHNESEGDNPYRRAALRRRLIERKAAGGAEPPQQAVAIPTGGGRPLPANVRDRMLPIVGGDLSGVQVHTGAESSRAATALGARAFADGDHLHFRDGEFAPGTKEGDRLLAHELTHVAERGAGVHRKAAPDAEEIADVAPAGSPSEQSADAKGDQAAERLHGRDEGQEDGDDVDSVSKAILAHGLTPDIETQVQKLSIRAIERLIDSLTESGGDEIKPTLTKLEALKKHKEQHKELMPHGEGHSFKGKEHYGVVKNEQKDRRELVNDTKKPAGKEFTHDKVRGAEGATLSGEDARLHERDHEAAGARAEEEEKAKHGKVAGKAIDVASKTHSTLVSKEAKAGAAVVDKKEQFGDGEHWGGDVHEKALAVDAKAGAEVDASWEKGLTVEGNAGATATLVSGGAKIHTPPLRFSIGGEQFIASFQFMVDAGALAEAKGKIAVNLHPKGDAGIEASISGFAGAKIGASAEGTLDWVKKSPESYATQLASGGGLETLLDHVLPDSLAKRVPREAVEPVLRRVLPVLLGSESGDALILGATLKGEGSVGIGAQADFAASFKGGVVHCHGKAGLTFGAGLGGEIDLQLGIRDGLGVLTVLAMRGSTHLMSDLKPAMQIAQYIKQHEPDILRALIAYCKQAQKETKSWWAQQVLKALRVSIEAAGGSDL